MNHCQCKLRKREKDQTTWITTWIPEKYAKIGKFIKLKNDNGWEVIEIGDKKDSREVQERSMDYRNQRKVSDI